MSIPSLDIGNLRNPKMHLDASCRIPAEDWDIHRHDFYEIELILSGGGVYSIDGTDYPIRRGALFMMSPISFHSVRFSEQTKLINIMFTEEVCDTETLVGIFAEHPYVMYDISPANIRFLQVVAGELISYLHLNTYTEEVSAAYSNIPAPIAEVPPLTAVPQASPPVEHDLPAQNSADLFSYDNTLPPGDTYARTLLGCILGKIRNLSGQVPQSRKISSIQHAMLYLQNHFTQNVRLEDAAKLAGYSPNYFSSQFKAYTGVSFKQYLCELRFSFAKKLLEYTAMSISEISAECGYADIADFSSEFKRRSGMSPKHYREREHS